MALIVSIAALLGVLAFGWLMAALGLKILRCLGLQFPKKSETLLFAVALGVITLEMGIFAAQVFNQVRMGVLVCLLGATIAGSRDFANVFRLACSIAASILAGSRLERFLVAASAFCLMLEGVASVAPLTGSDAMQYHFAGPLLLLRSGFKPNFFLTHSFYLGQGHLLVLAALAFGAEKVATSLFFLGGALTVGALICLASDLMSRSWAWACGLSFLLTPLVFWQISGAATPDLWMAFYVTLAVILLAHSWQNNRSAVALLAGVLAGAAAGTKYTGVSVYGREKGTTPCAPSSLA